GHRRASRREAPRGAVLRLQPGRAYAPAQDPALAGRRAGRRRRRGGAGRTRRRPRPPGRAGGTSIAVRFHRRVARRDGIVGGAAAGGGFTEGFWHIAAMTEFAPVPHALAHVSDWVFDLDNTLYPRACNLFAQIDVLITRYMMEVTQLAFDEARA